MDDVAVVVSNFPSIPRDENKFIHSLSLIRTRPLSTPFIPVGGVLVGLVLRSTGRSREDCVVEAMKITASLILFFLSIFSLECSS
ncbi:hypothetical protein B0H17DRAFT_1028391 [Mycena rosella]|uniref:Uncharacterized protein n=1 Tax=Mycena rosella TaxID=1033263 RepID=A0AAD7H1G6_MYCRO|nr:hypothetical protein B0H17DRAFT_1028391 [Mycena rosella]